MRPYHAVALTLLVLSCAHAPRGAMPTLSGSLDGFHFDRQSLRNGATVDLDLAPDGTWRGVWGYASGFYLTWESDQAGQPPLRLEARLTEGLLQSSWGDAPVALGPRYVSVHEQLVDLVLRRADGGPVPDALVVPLWLIMRTWELWPSRPFGRCVEVEDIGTVQLFVLPRRSAPYHLTVEDHCTFHFMDPALAESGPEGVSPAGPSRRTPDASVIDLEPRP